MRVGYQGEGLSYSDRAAKELFPNADRSGFQSFALAFAALAAGDVERLVLPIENSTTGSVLPVLDRVADPELSIVAEHLVEVRHALLGHPGADIAGVKRVRSHPEALAQATEVSLARGWEPVPAPDTAGAVRLVAEAGDPSEAALAPADAGKDHGLDVLESDVIDRAHNTTRFVVLAPGPPECGPEADKTSILFETAHRPGALALALSELGLRGANLTRIESRPMGSEAWSYHFFADFLHDKGLEGRTRVLDPTPATLAHLLVLGSYRGVVR
jgi:prephenate dehydratase